VRKSFCRICIASCGIDVSVADGRAVHIAGDRAHAMSRGYTCLKGRQMLAQVYAPARLQTAWRRTAAGGHEAISTGTALDEIAARVQSIIAEHGPQAVATYCGTAAYANATAVKTVRAWHMAIGSTMNFSSLTIDQPSKVLAVSRIGVWGGGPQTMDSADVIMLVGTNPLVSSLHIPGGPPGYYPPSLRAAQRRGLRLIVVDPRRTEVAARADIHLQVRPGEDPTLLAGLLRVILTEGRHDAAFCGQYLAGVDDLRRLVEPFTPDYVARRAGVPAAQLIEAARLFAAGPRGMVTSGTGPDMAPRPNLAEHLIACLNYVCGRVAREGEPLALPSLLTPLTPRPAQPFPPEFLPPDLNPQMNTERLRVRGFQRIFGELPTPGLADEILTPGDGQVRALIVIGGNPVLVWPDQDKTVRALEALDLLVTLDILPTATTRRSHYTIACAHPLERADLTLYQDMNWERPFAHYTDAVLPRPADVIEEWQFFAGLAHRMGTPIELPGGPLPSDPLPSTLDVLELLFPDAKVPIRSIAAFEGGHVFNEIDIRIDAPLPGFDAKLELAAGGALEELAAVVAEPLPEEGRYGGDGSYTHLLACRRMPHVANTVGREFPEMRKRGTHNAAYVHPTDLTRFGFRAGEVVAIESEHSRILGVIEPDDTVRPGVVSMSHGFGDDPAVEADVHAVGSCTSRLVSTDHHVDPLLGMPRQSAIPVRLRALDGVGSVVSPEDQMAPRCS